MYPPSLATVEGDEYLLMQRIDFDFISLLSRLAHLPQVLGVEGVVRSSLLTLLEHWSAGRDKS
jgi:hypothetical protein